jgi:hypothetical protein
VQRRAEQGAGVHSAELSRSKWRLTLGILSGGRVRVYISQLMGWQKMGQMAHVIFFSFYFSLLLFWPCIIGLYFYNLLFLHISKASPCLTPYRLKGLQVFKFLDLSYRLKGLQVFKFLDLFAPSNVNYSCIFYC